MFASKNYKGEQYIKLKLNKIFSKLKEIFSLDPRSLALFRIALGLLIIVDLLQRSRYLEAHYTDSGIMPRAVLIENFFPKAIFSFHLLSGEFWPMAILFIINGIFAFLLAIGWRTRLMTVICWFFLMSVQNRNTQILQGGDVLFRMSVFWGIFLPLGRLWSIDAKNKIKDYSLVFSAGSFAFIFQVFVLYFTAANHKMADPWIKNLDGVYTALNAEHFATSFAQVMLQYPTLLKFLSLFTLYLEGGLPFALIWPFYFQYTRALAVAMLICMHIGFAAALSVGLFWIIDIVALLALIPTVVWEQLEKFSIYEVVGFLREKFLDFLIGINNKVRIIFSTNYFKSFIHYLTNGFVLFCVVYIIFWVAPSYPGTEINVSPKWQWFGKFFGMDQRWQMFSPYPMSDDGWWVIVGKLKDGTEVDVLERKIGPVSFDKPKKLYKTYVSDRWRKYYRNLLIYKEKYAMLAYARGICRNWNSQEDQDLKKLDSFEVYFMLEMTLPNYQKAEVKKTLRWQHYCFQVPDAQKAKDN